MVLLAGSAGTGKTTLATLVAQHAGYRVMTLNARLIILIMAFSLFLQLGFLNYSNFLEILVVFLFGS